MAGLVKAYGRLIVTLALAGLVSATPAAATDEDLRSVSAMAGHNRILLVFAPNLSDHRLAQQRRTYAHFAPEAATRDLLLVQVADGSVIGAHDDSAKLRHQFGIANTAYRTLLIGKDGHVAIEHASPIDEATLRNAIDAMPARQEEVRRVRAGLGKSDK